MTKIPLFEVCAYNLQTCLIAQHAGASRIELCTNPLEGGITPSWGMLKEVLHQITIPVFVMIRPRGGNFVYDHNELAIMKQDIQMCKELGFPGVVVGPLNDDGSVNTTQLNQLAALAHPMEVTFHKAFDRTNEPFAALKAIIDSGCHRILTSGLKSNAEDGAALIKQLIAAAAGKIIIMPGGGIRSENIKNIQKVTGATEFHSSGLVTKGEQIADLNEITKIVTALNATT